MDWGTGARGAISVKWKNSRSGHYFNFENDDGKVRFIDPQNGIADCEFYFDDVVPFMNLFGRTDNIALSKAAYSCVRRKE